MATATEILDSLKKLTERLAEHVNEDDWDQATDYYAKRIQDCRKDIDEFEEVVVDTERRVTLLSADVVKLENA